MGEPSPPIWRLCATANGWSTANAHSADPRKCCATWPATPIVSPSPTAASSHSMTTASPSSGRITASKARAIQGDDARYLRVHPPLPDACIATGLSSHPLLRSAHQPNPRQEYRSCPRVARSAAHPDRCHQSCQRHVRRAKTTRASLPLLRWPHDHHRDLLARPTAKCFEKPSAPPHTGPTSNQDRHLMIPPPPIRPRIDHLHPGSLSPGSAPACTVAPPRPA